MQRMLARIPSESNTSKRGFKWNSYDFVTDKPAREQLDAAIASSAAREGK